MSEEFKNDLKELHKQGKLSDFEYNQLVCLNRLTDRLIEVSDVLRKIAHNLEAMKKSGW